MSRQVEQLLRLARADAGFRLERGPVALGPLIAEAVEELRVLHPDHPIRWESEAGGAKGEGAGNGGTVVLGDRDALQQLLLILGDNACKYSDPGRPVRLALRVHGEEALVEVEDEGIGIPPEEVERIFERFHRAPTSQGRVEGAGLGLAIARWIAEEHGGRIEVASRPGEGSRFTLRLPLA